MSDVDAAFCDAMPVAHNVSDYGTCDFSIGYLDGSVGGGYMVEDVVTVGDELAPAKMIFGCGGLVEADGRYTRQDGMAGFGRGSPLPGALAKRASSTAAGFCSRKWYGYRDVITRAVRFRSRFTTACIRESSVTMILRSGRRLGDSTRPPGRRRRHVLDSGTTLVLVPTVMFESFKTLLVTQLTHIQSLSFWRMVFVSSPATVLTAIRPNGSETDHHVDDIHLTLAPENYLHSHPFLPHVLRWIEESEDDIILLGQQTLRNTFAEYDLENLRRRRRRRCETLRKNSPQTRLIIRGDSSPSCSSYYSQPARSAGWRITRGRQVRATTPPIPSLRRPPTKN